MLSKRPNLFALRRRISETFFCLDYTETAPAKPR
jgi:hypothetical protein